MHPISAPMFRQILFIALLTALFCLLFWYLKEFIPAILGAYTLYVLLRKWMEYLTERLHWRKHLAAAALIILSFFVVLVPMFLIFQLLNTRVIGAVQNSPEILERIEASIHQLENQYGLNILTKDNVKALTDWAVVEIQHLFKSTLSGVLTVVLTFFLLWFMLVQNKKMEESFFSILPFQNANIKFVRDSMNDLVFSNALGIPVLAIIQGLFALVGYWVIGVDNIWVWFIATCFAGVLPIFGVALAYVPLCLTLIAQGRVMEAVILFAYGFIVVGSVDNIFRMWLLRKIGHTHPLVTLFGVLVGLQIFGFIGFIFGPILISLFILLVQIYQKEFMPLTHKKVEEG